MLILIHNSSILAVSNSHDFNKILYHSSVFKFYNKCHFKRLFLKVSSTGIFVFKNVTRA